MFMLCLRTSAVSVNDPGVSMILKDVSHERAMTSKRHGKHVST